MNSTIRYNLSRAFGNFTTTAGCEKEPGSIVGGVQIVVGKIAETLTSVGQNYGFWKFIILLFAIIGFLAIISAIFGKLVEGLGVMFKIFIVLPMIVIVGLINKKKRKKRLSQWGELKKQMKKQNKKISKKVWVFWVITRIVLPLSILGILLWRIFP